jgi:hypothetical protein
VFKVHRAFKDQLDSRDVKVFKEQQALKEDKVLLCPEFRDHKVYRDQ